MKRLVTIAIILGLGALPAAARSGPVEVSADALAEAHSALQSGEATRALSLLQRLPQSGPKAAEAQNVECRVRFTLQQWSAAAKACAQAVRLDGQNSDYHLWLGRALGEQAGAASFLSAYSLSKQARAEFETAAHLDPRNKDALSDLGEFYVDAPSIVGGGLDKAESVAEELDRIDRARAADLRGRIAYARKDYGTAEQDFKQAIALSPHPSRAWATLASFYRHQKEWEQMEWAVRNCASAAARDPNSGVALFNGASVLVQANRDPELAAKMLEDYLKQPAKTEEGPAFQAHVWLARLKTQMGDAAGAQQEQAVAKELAGEYLPQKGLGR
ncbi:MAG TPA: tetratricopeptide repeat protein [Terracidiphilus sp.]|nr:tetratricopeptide repeat protein [Terracidiphilus sp.]